MGRKEGEATGAASVGKGLSEEVAFDLKNEKLPRGDLQEKWAKQQCSEGKGLEKRGACVLRLRKEATSHVERAIEQEGLRLGLCGLAELRKEKGFFLTAPASCGSAISREWCYLTSI